jgi:hypothetical protein
MHLLYDCTETGLDTAQAIANAQYGQTSPGVTPNPELQETNFGAILRVFLQHSMDVNQEYMMYLSSQEAYGQVRAQQKLKRVKQYIVLLDIFQHQMRLVKDALASILTVQHRQWAAGVDVMKAEDDNWDYSRDRSPLFNVMPILRNHMHVYVEVAMWDSVNGTYQLQPFSSFMPRHPRRDETDHNIRVQSPVFAELRQLIVGKFPTTNFSGHQFSMAYSCCCRKYAWDCRQDLTIQTENQLVDDSYQRGMEVASHASNEEVSYFVFAPSNLVLRQFIGEFDR